ncbi:MAG TPA: SHOCT domain-containing protein [Smithellaceae bacterium]|jgi:putative membrane protein|nr:SHOCT domain-containing protein [Smithellaceae bacterium]HQF85383.1 SHOCT domain-containing protein [Smithellaceae bacterium]HQG81597.1 SHOCT domain-containing protein [Smithellaceae bacterium]
MKKLFGAVVSCALAFSTYACAPRWPMHRWDGPDMMGWGFGYGGMFMWLIFLVVLAVAIYFIVVVAKNKNLGGTNETPLEILKKRYAKGEITKEEFDRIKNDLS